MFQTGFYKQESEEESEEEYAQHQVFTPEHWAKLEAFGAVFLPAAGFRKGFSVINVQYNGIYWSATEDGSDEAYYLYFTSDEAGMYSYNRSDGQSVRLVKDLQ